MTPSRPSTLEEAWQAIAERDARIAQFEPLIAKLAAQVDEPTHRLAQNSSNASKRPSSDGPGGAPSGRPKTGRSRGGQKGHRGHRRALVENPDRVIPAVPSSCAACGLPLHGHDPAPSRHQVTDLPPLRPIVTEYQWHRRRCACGHVTAADWPQDMPVGAFGPRITALVGYLASVGHLSHAQTKQPCADLFGVAMATGSVANYRTHVATALREPHTETTAAVQRAAHVHADETPLGPPGRGGWLWVGVGARATTSVCAQGRG